MYVIIVVAAHDEGIGLFGGAPLRHVDVLEEREGGISFLLVEVVTRLEGDFKVSFVSDVGFKTLLTLVIHHHSIQYYKI